MKACFIGLGYIGLPTAIIAANSGIDIVGVDINAEVVEKTQRGKLHILEPGLQPMLKRVVDSGKLVARTTPVPSDAFFIVVPTPFKENHLPDISFVEAATRSVIPFLQEGNLFVIESTSPVGTTEAMA
ncbi:MAG: UDP-N-acetyl-D-mannosamine dehydrogenase, partial [Bacteroidales bacterium]|nr:UDP-N-acetyl-D-mannosamine dehydrogenase [Bacteroidales bacterium]